MNNQTDKSSDIMDTSSRPREVKSADTTFRVSHLAQSHSELLLPTTQPPQLLSKKQLEDLLHEIDPNQILDEDVAEILLQMADDFIESVVTASCELAKHRKSATLEAKDVQLHLERSWNMWIPGFGVDDKTPKKSLATEAHKQRLALLRKPSKNK